jgi:glutathione S-transferase
MLKLYDFAMSGSCHKVRLILSFLGLECELIPINLKASEQKTPEFLQLNPWGQVPVLVDGDFVIRDSQAILVYLCQKYSGETWWPQDAESMGLVMQWLAIAAGEIYQGLAPARMYYKLGRPFDIEAVTARAHSTLQVFEQHLSQRQWLELDRPTLADVACFPYVALAGDAKINLADYPHVMAWVERFKQLPGYVTMPGL